MFRGSDIPRILAVAGIALLAACSDATAPTESATPSLSQRAAAAAAPAEMPTSVRQAIYVTNVATTKDSVVVDFVVTPSGGWFVVGYNAVYFPPNSICEPTTSSYGPTTWDRPCTPASGPVAIRGRAGSAPGNRGWIHFDTDLRFVPTSDPARWVRIYMWTQVVQRSAPADSAAVERQFDIFWVPTPGATPVDESLTDPTLKTSVYWGSGIVSRRVKHFSGYQVGNGYVEDAGTATDAEQF